MEKRIVAIVRFEKPLESVCCANDLSRGLELLPSKATSYQTRHRLLDMHHPFSKMGITKSWIAEDTVILLQGRGMDISLEEEITTHFQNDGMN